MKAFDLNEPFKDSWYLSIRLQHFQDELQLSILFFIIDHQLVFGNITVSAGHSLTIIVRIRSIVFRFTRFSFNIFGNYLRWYLFRLFLRIQFVRRPFVFLLRSWCRNLCMLDELLDLSKHFLCRLSSLARIAIALLLLQFH